MNDETVALPSWFSERHQWLQEAVARLVRRGSFSTDDVTDLVDICKAEAEEALATVSGRLSPPLTAEELRSGCLAGTSLRLMSISDIEGVNALSPKEPLQFGNNSLYIIYAPNGAGKSGYVRILKHSCGARDPGKLLPNAFNQKRPPQKATLHYELNGQPRSAEFTPGGGKIGDLSAVSIFDSDCARVYVTRENEIAVEPLLLQLFTGLVDVCGSVASRLEGEVVSLVDRKPTFPITLASTDAAAWFRDLSHRTSDEEIVSRTHWTHESTTELQECERRLGTTDPIGESTRLREAAERTSQLLVQIESIHHLVDESGRAELEVKRQRAEANRRAVTAVVDAAFASSPLEGIGTAEWRALWNAARAYGELVVHPHSHFPKVDSETRCLLCQQTLDEAAKQRFVTFESYVQGKLETEAANAESALQAALAELRGLPDALWLEGRLADCGVDRAGSEWPLILQWFEAALIRRDALLQFQVTQLEPPPPDSAVLSIVSRHAGKLVTGSQEMAKQADPIERQRTESRRGELLASKWLHDQEQSVRDEVDRLRKVHFLRRSILLTDTTTLSIKKSSLADTLVTSAFVERFNTELDSLRGKRIAVKLIKTRTTKGRVWHQIQLRDAFPGVAVLDVLSEGEFRIVSLAAFFADVGSDESSCPVIFDDPITSLDQEYEEAVMDRVASLSSSRQVIVFTHRLSTLALLEFYAAKVGTPVTATSLSKERSEIGNPRQLQIRAKKPDRALAALLNESLKRARKILNEEGAEAYELHAKAICSEARILLERIVELDLLNNVVERFRRDIQTKGKLHELAKIKIEDCSFIDALMTKLSRFEHAQPNEAPVDVPSPDDIEADLTSLQQWREQFKSRSVS